MVHLIDNPDKAEHVAEIVKAMAHPLRLRILAILKEGDQNVKSLAERLGVPHSLASLHLRTLRIHGILNASREGATVRYTLARPRLKELIEYLDGCPD
jgi:DNA-binding transcriptional ArsR family regulator